MHTVKGQVEQDIPQSPGLDCSGQVLTAARAISSNMIFHFNLGLEMEMREEPEAPSVAVGYELSRVSSGPVLP